MDSLPFRTTRRHFLAGGAGASTLLAGGAVFGPQQVRSGMLPLSLVIYDERFSPARRFAATAQSIGARIHAIQGEVHALWYDNLAPLARAAGTAFAGMTNQQTLFLLEMVAAEAGMRVIYRAHHDRLNGPASRHESFGPTEVLASTTPLPPHAHEWAEAAARLVLEWPATMTSIRAGHSTIGEARLRAPQAEQLVSWIIAQRRN